MVDVKLNFRVRKRRQPPAVNVKEKAPDAESLAPKPPPSTEDNLSSFADLVAGGLPSAVAADADRNGYPLSTRRQSTRVLKRVAEVKAEKFEVKTSLAATELSASRSGTVPRVSKKRAAAPKLVGLPAPAAASTDFWHSCLSERSAGKQGSTTAIISGKTLFAADEIARALEHLKSADPLLKTVIDMHEAPKFEKCGSAFTALCRSIVFQQLATKAASAIFARLVILCEGLDNLTPTTISQLSVAQMREVGISGRKASYLHDLAANFLSGALSEGSIYEMDDESLIKALIAVKGIGMWSVHMFMLFSLHKPDVLPVTDLGVRKGLKTLYKLKELPTAGQAEKIASSWQPYRSLGSWYMWRVLSNTPM